MLFDYVMKRDFALGHMHCTAAQATALVRQAFRLLETAKQRQHAIPCVLFENVRIRS